MGLVDTGVEISVGSALSVLPTLWLFRFFDEISIVHKKPNPTSEIRYVCWLMPVAPLTQRFRRKFSRSRIFVPRAHAKLVIEAIYEVPLLPQIRMYL